tara:strand:- start:468 stop:887 length:420 start_codon:yes stop_codon:yes gene_type:complete
MFQQVVEGNTCADPSSNSSEIFNSSSAGGANSTTIDFCDSLDVSTVYINDASGSTPIYKDSAPIPFSIGNSLSSGSDLISHNGDISINLIDGLNGNTILSSSVDLADGMGNDCNGAQWDADVRDSSDNHLCDFRFNINP